MGNKYQSTLEALSRPFIKAGLYESEEAFLKDLAQDLARRRIKAYEDQVRKFERKYQSWEKFSEEIAGKASPAQEDDWMEWEGARNMLNAWKELAELLP
jgi:hypothetical protein